MENPRAKLWQDLFPGTILLLGHFHIAYSHGGERYCNLKFKLDHKILKHMVFWHVHTQWNVTLMKQINIFVISQFLLLVWKMFTSVVSITCLLVYTRVAVQAMWSRVSFLEWVAVHKVIHIYVVFIGPCKLRWNKEWVLTRLFFMPPYVYWFNIWATTDS